MVRIYEETGKYKEANNLKEKLKIATVKFKNSNSFFIIF